MIAVTAGEPAGIGPDLCVMLAQKPRTEQLVIIANAQMLEQRARALGLPWRSVAFTPEAAAAPPGTMAVIDVPLSATVTPGTLNVANAPAVLRSLEIALDGCLDGRFDAIVTAPVHKGIINDAGVAFTGHTEFFAERTQTPRVVMMLIGALLIFSLKHPPKGATRERPTLANLFGGFRYIWRQKIVLGAISLDLFAVLMGGVVALMPIYADQILHLGPAGVGWLRAAPGIGAIATAAVLAIFPIRDNAGIIMFLCVGLFGAFTVVFGFSTIPLLSILALICLGAADMVSVVVRETLLQLWTPDDVRGRVNAVNGVFVSASNELGEYRAGTMAGLIGPGALGAVPAAVIGGFGAIAVAVIWAVLFPQLRRQRHLTGGVEQQAAE